MPKQPVNRDGRGQSVTEVLRALRKKLWLQRMVHDAATGLVVGLCLAVLELIAARILPIWYPGRLALILTGSGLTAGLLAALWRRPSVMEAARFADEGGLQERMLTALSFQEDDSLMAAVQREEAVGMFHREEERVMKRAAVWRVPRWIAGCFVLFVISGSLLWFLPNPMQDVVQKQQRVKQVLEQEQQKVKEQEEAIAKNETLTPEQKDELQKQLQKLREELAASDNLEEGMQALATAEAELDRLAEQAAKQEQALNNLHEQLAGNAATKDLADALAERDADKLRDAMQSTRHALEQLTEEEREALAGQLSQAAQELSGHHDLSGKELADALSQTANQLQAGDIGLAADALQDVVSQAIADSQAAMAAGNAAGQTAQSLASSKQALAQAGQAGAAGSQTAQNNNPANGGGNGNTGSSGSGDTSGTNGQGDGSGTGNGSGSGDGQGKGSQGGQGNGTSGSNGSGSGTGGSGTGSGGSGAGVGNGSRDLVSVPSARIKGDGPEETVGGALGSGAETKQSRGSAIGSPGVSRPYTEVFGQYERAARTAIQRSDLPPQYQQLVKDYFTDISPVKEQSRGRTDDR